MPGFDRTGPMGKGSQTGRKMGKCNSKNETEPEEIPRGRGFGRRFARKRRFGTHGNSPGDGN